MLINNLLIIVVFTALVLILVGRKWEIQMAGLAIVDLIVFISIVQIWPIALASVKLIAGWMGVILISARQIIGQKSLKGKAYISQTILSLLTTLILWIMVTAAAPAFNEWIPIPYANLYIGMLVISAGLVFASTNQDSFSLSVGILTMLSGFDLIYSSLEGSALVTGIYAMIVISIALLNTYLPNSVGNLEL